MWMSQITLDERGHYIFYAFSRGLARMTVPYLYFGPHLDLGPILELHVKSTAKINVKLKVTSMASLPLFFNFESISLVLRWLR